MERAIKSSVLHVYDYTRPIMKDSFMKGDCSYVWLLKPTNLNRGRGIEIFQSLEQLEKLLNDYYEGIQEKSYSKAAVSTHDNAHSETPPTKKTAAKLEEKSRQHNLTQLVSGDEPQSIQSSHLYVQSMPNQTLPEDRVKESA